MRATETEGHRRDFIAFGGGVVTSVGPILSPATAWLSMIVGVVALVYGFWPRAKQIHVWLGFRIGRFTWLIWTIVLAVLAFVLVALWERSRVDERGLCFVAFRVWDHDQKMVITALAQNRNKDMVLLTLIGRDFSLDGFPLPDEPEVAESKPLYPEESYTTFDSVVVPLGRYLPIGTMLHGRVNFLVRYGPTPSDTKVLKIKGRVDIRVGGLTNGRDEAYWTADPDSTPDCPGIQSLIGKI